MKSKHLLMAASLLVVLAMLVGCAAPTTQAPAASEEQPVAEPAAETAAKPFIPVISKGFQHQFWQAVKQGAEQAAADYNVDITFEGPATEAEVDKQIEMLQAALAKNPQAICLAALDTQAAIPLLEEAKAKGIPVVGFDSGVDSDIPVSTATTDNIAAAALAADKMAELIGGSGQVAVLVHDQTSRCWCTTRPAAPASTVATASSTAWQRPTPTSISSTSTTARATTSSPPTSPRL